MDPVRNPYSPGAGRKPAALVGRDEAIRGWSVAVQRVEHGRTDQPFVLYGLRGVGKTVLLSEFRRNAARRGWVAAQVEAGSGKPLRELLGEALYGPLRELAKPTAGRRILQALATAASFKASYDTQGTWSFGIDLSGVMGGGAGTGILDTDLRELVHDLSRAAEEAGGGLAILVDEAQDLVPEELAVLCAIAHAAAQDDWRVLFAFAGLPSLPRILAEAKSYAERFRYLRVEKIAPGVVAQALSIPAAQEDASWEDDAISVVVAASDRYPYFLQQFGQSTWNRAAGPTITKTEAELGVLDGRNQLDNGFFRIRWDRATRAEQKYLRKMAEDGDTGSSSRDVATRLGRTTGSVSPTRNSLIAKGLVYAPEHGIVAFTVPGMAAFIDRQIDG